MCKLDPESTQIVRTDTRRSHTYAAYCDRLSSACMAGGMLTVESLGNGQPAQLRGSVHTMRRS